MSAAAYVLEYWRRGLGDWAPLTESTGRTGYIMRQVRHPSRDAAAQSVCGWEPGTTRICRVDAAPDYEEVQSSCCFTHSVRTRSNSTR